MLFRLLYRVINRLQHQQSPATSYLSIFFHTSDINLLQLFHIMCPKQNRNRITVLVNVFGPPKLPYPAEYFLFSIELFCGPSKREFQEIKRIKYYFGGVHYWILYGFGSRGNQSPEKKQRLYSEKNTLSHQCSDLEN